MFFYFLVFSIIARHTALFNNQKLMEQLIWYNTEKPHRAIGKLLPLLYYLDNFGTTPQKVQYVMDAYMWWTRDGLELRLS